MARGPMPMVYMFGLTMWSKVGREKIRIFEGYSYGYGV